jgi:hypothetical protein
LVCPARGLLTGRTLFSTFLRDTGTNRIHSGTLVRVLNCHHELT